MGEVPVSSPLASLSAHRQEVDSAIGRVLSRGTYVLGPEVESFESEFAAYVGSTHAVGVNSGTDALALALRALDVGPGDEVITVSHTAVATVSAIEQAGASPVLVDVDRSDLTMDPGRFEAAVTPRTRAVVPVHLYGNVADMDRIGAIAARNDIAVIEDASQAHGAEWRNTKVGGLASIATVFSCYPTKNLGALGDAGVVTTNDPYLAQRVRRLRQYGWEERNHSLAPGVNSRLDELQAAILRVKLRHLPSDIDKRRRVATTYTATLQASVFSLLKKRPHSEGAFHLYVVLHPQRDVVRDLLAQHMVCTAVHYPVPIHRQAAYAGRIQVVGDMRITETACQEVLSLPMFPELTEGQIERVLAALADALRLELKETRPIREGPV